MAEARAGPPFAAPPGHGLDSLAAAAAAEGKGAAPGAMAAAGAGGAAAGGGALALVPGKPESPAGPGACRIDVRVQAQLVAAQPVPVHRPDLWGLLTAVSDKARKRPQGHHIMLYSVEHLLGRVVKEVSCSFDSPNVSGKHCKISRKVVAVNGSVKPMQADYALVPGERIVVMVKDSSSNGTFINQQRLRREGPEECLKHGDLISLVGLPEQENAFTFVYRDVAAAPKPSIPQEVLDAPKQGVKRKVAAGKSDQPEDDGGWDGKRMKGLLVGGPDGPVSLDDVRRLQRSNEELRQQLEEHVLTIEKMRSEFRAAEGRHETELKELKASISARFAGEIEMNSRELEQKKKELEDMAATSVQQQSVIEDLNQRLAAASQSRVDAEELIQSQKANIADLEKRVEDERNERQRENADSQIALKVAVEKARAEAAEELKQQTQVAAKQQKQQQDTIQELQEADKENRRLTESLRVKLEKEREALVNSEERYRRLEAQLQDERNSSESARKRAADREQELENINKELENEKKAKDAATDKASVLELEMETAIRELALEKRKLQGARERIVLRETQLRAFHSTAEEIASLQQKQQDQLKGMLRTLEDGEDETDAIRTQGIVDIKRPEPGDERSGSYGDRTKVSETVNKEPNASGVNVGTAGESDYAAVQADTHTSEEGNGSIPAVVAKENSEGGFDEQGLSEKAEVHVDTQQEWVGGETQEDCSVVADSESDTSMAGDLDVVQDTLIDEADAKEISSSLRCPLDVLKTQVVDLETMQSLGRVDVAPEQHQDFECSPMGSPPARFSFRRASLNGGKDVPSSGCLASVNIGQREAGNGREKSADVHGSDTGADIIPGETMLVDEEEAPKTFPCWEVPSTQVFVRDEGKENIEGANRAGEERSVLEPARLDHFGTFQLGRDGKSLDGSLLDTRTPLDLKIESAVVAIRQDTGDLLASEAPGSWAVSSASELNASKQDNQQPGESFERHYPRESEARSEEQGVVQVVSSQGGTSDNELSRAAAPGSILIPATQIASPDARNSQSSSQQRTFFQPGSEHVALNEMLNIVAPELGKLQGIQALEEVAPDSEDSTDDDDDDDDGGGGEPGFVEQRRMRAGIGSQG